MQWRVPEPEFRRQSYENVEKFLQETGIYQVVSEKEARETIGNNEIPYWQWQKDNYALARQAAKAMHANYVVLLERGRPVGGAGFTTWYWEMVIVNVENENKFRAIEYIERSYIDDFRPILRRAYRKIFDEAKKDMLEMAVRKGRAAIENDEKINIHPPDIKAATSVPDVKAEEIAIAPEIKIAAPPFKTEKKSPDVIEKIQKEEAMLEKSFGVEPGDSGKPRLVVYDLETVKNFEVVAIILADALREEIFKLKKFILVNRDNIGKVIDEMKLQQSGMTDETQAVQIGKWLSAREAVTGKLGMLGRHMVVYAKRLDIQTLGTLGIGSLKCQAGNEEELLNAMPELAKKLIEKQ